MNSSTLMISALTIFVAAPLVAAPPEPVDRTLEDEVTPVALSEGDAMLREPGRHVGAPVTVRGQVSQVTPPNLFAVDTDGRAGPGDIVVTLGKAERLPGVGDKVLVQGALVRRDLRPDHTAAADPEHPGLIEHGDAVVVEAREIGMPTH